MSFRVDLLGADGDEPERIGVIFTAEVAVTEEGAAAIELTPEDALELAARLSDMYALHRRWLDARSLDAGAPPQEHPPTCGLTVENYRLHILLKAGYAIDDAERLAKDARVDLRQAEKLANQAGPELAARIL
jgi:hypothetical protein